MSAYDYFFLRWINTAPITSTATITPEAINAMISNDNPLSGEFVGVVVDEGEFEGEFEGEDEGETEGDADGEGEAVGEGEAEGVDEGDADGEGEGLAVGCEIAKFPLLIVWVISR